MKFYKSHILFFPFIILFLLLTTNVEAHKYWVAADDGTTKIWHDNNNWSNSDGGAPGVSPPNQNQEAWFTSGSTVDALITGVVEVKKLRLRNGYTGTVNVNDNYMSSKQGVEHNSGTLLVSGTGYFHTWGRGYYLYNGGTLTATGSDSKIKIGHNFHMYSGSTFNAPSAGLDRFVLRGGFNLHGGTFNHNSGTVWMNSKWNGTVGAAIKIVGGPGPGKNFYDLYKNATKNVTLNTNIEIENDFTNIGGGKIRANGKNITVGGDWDFLQNAFVHQNGTVTFNGSSAQTIDSPSTFKNVTISNSAAEVSLSGTNNANITGTLTINSGANFDINSKNLTANTLVNNGNLQLQGSETVNITTMDIDSGTVTYDGSGATGLAAGNNYFNLTFNQSGTSTLDANLDVNGELTITSGTLDVSTSDHNINVAGNWTNNGSFISRSGLVTFDDTSDITAGGTSATKDFNNVTLSGTAGSQSDDIKIGGNFLLSGSGTWYTNCNTMTVDGSTTNASGTITNTLAPDVDQFIPADGNLTHAAGDNITIKFNTLIQRASDNAALDDDNVDALITFKQDNASGSTIDFNATINNPTNTEITIDPASDLSSSQVVYVAVGNSLENTCETALPAHSATITVADTANPILDSSNPANEAPSVAVDANIVLTFNENVDAESGNITIIKSSDSSTVEAIDVTDSSKVTGSGSTEITVNPGTNLDEKTVYYINIDADAFDDSSGNSYAGINGTDVLYFTTADTTPPVVSITPSNGDTGIGMSTNITIEFDELIRRASDNATLDDDNVKDHLILKETNSSGADIAFDVTINSPTNTEITIDPTTDFSSGQTIYVAIKAEVEDASNNAISLSESTFTTATPTNPPTVTFGTDAGVPVDTNITIEFDKSVRLLGNGELIDGDLGNLASLITLKDTDVNGNNIGFVATINSAKTKITINPNSNFTSGQTIYVAIGATVEDYFDNAITAASATFTAADSTPPTYEFDPEDTDSNVPVNKTMTITFSEKVRKIDNTVLDDNNVDSLITLKDSDSSGSNITFNATINSPTNTIITIDPTSNFSSEQDVYLAIGATVEDYSGNAITESHVVFTAVDSDPPVIDFFPINSSTGIAVNSDMTISFSEPVRNIDNTPITDSNVDSLITLKQNNSSGADISFTAVVDRAKQMITITPASNFSSEQVVYVAIGATVEDEWGNAISSSSSTFTTADSTAPSVNFDPPDTSTGIPIESNVTLTFTEAIRNIDDSLITNSNVGNLISLEYAFDHSPIPFTATIDAAKKVITINPDSNFISGEVVFVSIESVEDNVGNAMGSTSGTFSVTDSTAPTVIFSPANLSTNVAVDTDILITFDEEIRLIDNSSINNINVDNLITVKNTNSSGSDISFDATIDANSKIITIDLSSDLTSEQIIYVAIGSTVEDSYDNSITNSFAIFTVADALPPTVTIDAVITASIATNSNITFTFSEAVRNLDDSEITDSNVGSLITLRDTDANGTDLSFTATINTAKTVIIIDPTNNFTSGQIVYAAIGATVEDFNNNVIPATSKTFTAEYLVADLTNPLNDKDFVGLLQAQTETAKRFIQQSTTSVLKRMEWLRRNREGRNLSHQGVSVNFIDSELNELSNALQLSNFFNQSGDLFSDDWAVWSEGNITIGEVDATGVASLKDIETNGITFGIDNKIDANHMLGAALRIGKDDVEIGSSDHKLDTDTYSLSLYGTLPYNDKTYIDGTLGISLLDMDHTRKHASGTLTGSRDGKQLFGSIVYSAELEKGQLTVSPYGRLDGGYTILSSYSDSGTVAAIRYDEQKIKTGMISIGLLADDKIEIKNFKINRYGRLEYGKDISSSSNAVVSYVAVPNTKYSLNIDDDESSNIRAGFGVDIETMSKWSYQLDYEINHRLDSSHMDTLSAAAFYELELDTIISLSLDTEEFSHSAAKLEFDSRLTNGWFLNGAYEITDNQDLNYENTLNLQAVRYF